MPTIQGEYLAMPILDEEGKFEEMAYRPVVQLRMNYKRGQISKAFKALVDSGSDFNLFPADIAYAYKIKLERGKKRNTFGIGNYQITSYMHSGFKFYVGKYSFDTLIYFSEEAYTPLLGEVGFFDKFKKVTFQKKAEVVELEY